MSKLTHIHIRQKAVAHKFEGTGGGKKSYVPEQNAFMHGTNLLQAINLARDKYLTNALLNEIPNSRASHKNCVNGF